MRRGFAIAFVLASIAPASSVHAALIATSHEITVNTHADGWQHDPSVAVAPGTSGTTNRGAAAGERSRHGTDSHGDVGGNLERLDQLGYVRDVL